MAGRALEPSKLTGLMTAINDLARGSPALAKMVNPDHLKLLVMQAADDFPESGALDVTPLFDYLRELAPPRDEVEAILCAFLRRAQNLGVATSVPRPLQQLTEEERARLAEIALGRSQSAQKAGTFVGQAPTSRPGQAGARPIAPATASPAAASPPSASGAPSTGPAARKAPPSSRTKALLGVALAAALGGAIFFLAPLLGPDPVRDATVLFGPPGDGERYTCARVMVSDKTVVCFIALPTPLPADHAAKLAALAAFGQANGWASMVFVDPATNGKIPTP